MPAVVANLKPGQRVRVIQQVPRLSGTWTTEVEGVVVSFRRAKTGSWFAHAKDDRLWLDRLDLRLDDGELTSCSLDQYSRVEVLGEASGPPGEPTHLSQDPQENLDSFDKAGAIETAQSAAIVAGGE